MSSHRAGIGAAAATLIVSVVLMVAAIGFISLIPQSAPNPSSTGSTGTSNTLVIDSISLLIPQNQPICVGPPALCTIAQHESDIQLSGKVSVNESTPLSCLDVYIDGSSEVGECWNIISPAFTTTECNGSGNQNSCSLIINSNTYTETALTTAFDMMVNNGTDNGPAIFAGRSYQITLVGMFQDRTNATASAVVVATNGVASTVTTTTISTGTLTSPQNSSISSSPTDTPEYSSCGSNVTLEDSNSNGSLYVSSDAEVGDSVCMTASLNDSPQVNLSITNSSGSVVFSGSCVATPPPGAPAPTGDTCTAYWDTASPDPQGNPMNREPIVS